MRTRLAGPDGGAAPGELRIFDELRAKLLVDGGYAEYADVPASPELASTPAVEAAALEAPEASVMEPPKPRVAGRRR